MPGRLMSKEYFAAPVVLRGESMREICLPISVRLSAEGQSTFAILNAPFLRGVRDCEQHAGVGAATAEIPAEPSADFVNAGLRMLPHEGGRCHDEPGRAETALLGVMFHEGLLHCVQF